MSFRNKLILLLTLVGLLPMAAIYYQYLQHNQTIKTMLYSELSSEATVLSNIIDRSLFERFYDVQAFSLKFQEQNFNYPITSTRRQNISDYFNSLVKFYGVYRRIVLLSPDGELLATSTKTAEGQSLSNIKIVPSNLIKSEWFSSVLKKGSGNSNLSTTMVGPLVNPLAISNNVEKNIPELVFAYPVFNQQGEISAILVNLMDFMEIDVIFSDYQNILNAQGINHDNLFLIDSAGNVLLENVKNINESSIGDNWITEDFNVAKHAIEGKLGAEESHFPHHKGKAFFGYANSSGAYNFKGTDWSVVVSRPTHVALSYIQKVNLNVQLVVFLVMGFVVLASLIFSQRLTRSLDAVNAAVLSLAKYHLDIKIPKQHFDRTLSKVWESLSILRRQLIYKLDLEQKNSEQRAELLLKNTAMEMAPAGVIILDCTQKKLPIIYANKSFYKMTAYKDSEVLGRDCQFLLGDDKNQDDVVILKSAISNNQSAEVILRNYRKNGEMFWNHIYVSPVTDKDNKVTHYVLMLADVTQLKEFEKEIKELNQHLEQRVIERTDKLQHAELQLRTTLDTMIDALVVVDSKGQILQANNTTASMFDYEMEDLLSQNIGIILTEDNNIENIQQWLADLLVEEKFYGELIDTTARKKSGLVLPVELSVTSLSIEGQYCYTVVIRDISDRKSVEIKLLKAKEEAEKANKTKSEFLGNMSHELRTPMNAVIGMTDLVLDSVLTKDQRHQLNVVSKSAHSLLSLLNEILDLTKLEHGSMEIAQEVFDLWQTLHTAVTMVEIQAYQKGVYLTYHIAKEVPRFVIGDALRLRQVLINLVGNAIKFTDEGQVKVNITLSEDNQELIHFSVEDTGIGIEDERLQSIFEPFFQADTSITRRFGGTGLGTTISRQLVEKMGGKIWVESEVDKGSNFQFCLTLPVADSDEDRAALDNLHQIPSFNVKSKQPLKILLAEDVAVNSELIEYRVGRDGHKITLANNGLKAVELFKDNKGDYDYIFMDIHMPVMNGYQAASLISEYSQQEDISVPIIALTASGMEEEKQKCTNSGMVGFVIKPIDFSMLYHEMYRLSPDLFEEVTSIDKEMLKSALPDIANQSVNQFNSSKNIIDFDSAVNNWGDEALYLQMLVSFSNRWQIVSHELTEMLHDEHYQSINETVHSLKGAAGNLGIKAVFSQCKKIEVAIKHAESSDNIYGLIEQLAIHMDMAVNTIANFDFDAGEKVMASSVDSQISMEDGYKLLVTLRGELERGMVNDELIDTACNFLNQHIDKASLNLFIEQIDEFNFAAAINKVTQVIDKIMPTSDSQVG